MEISLNRAFQYLTLGVFCILLIPEMFREGMFMDGLIYSTLGHNLANGIGTFWNPSFSSVVMAGFYEHPPLAFGLQSILYSIFGSGFYIEKIYSALMAVATAYLIIKIWKLVNPDQKIKKLYWLPVLLWITMPRCFWSYKNNMLENTMGMFSILAVYLLIVSVSRTGPRRWTLIGVAALSLVCSALAKGFPGLFPLGVLFFCFLFSTEKKYRFGRMFIDTAVLFVMFALLICGILLYEPAAQGLGRYFDTQVMGSLQGKRVVVESRWHIMGALMKELYPLLGLIFIILLMRYRGAFWRIAGNKISIKQAAFFTIIGLSATMPMMVSPKQLSFYVVPALPYFALAAGFVLSPVISGWSERVSTDRIWIRLVKIAGIGLLAGAVIMAAMNAGTPVRDKDMLADIDKIALIVPHRSTIKLSPALRENWSLMAYFQRKYFISLDPSGPSHAYMIVPEGEEIPDGFSVEDNELKQFVLLRRNVE